MSCCDLQVLYNVRPQAVTADDLVGTAYDVRLRDFKLARHLKMRHSSRSIRWYWPLLLGLLASAAYVLFQHHRQALPV